LKEKQTHSFSFWSSLSNSYIGRLILFRKKKDFKCLWL
jgi:hypothetical protein